MVAVKFTENYIDPNKQTKMAGNDRIFVLEALSDKVPLSQQGDKRLFTGEKKMHAIRDESSFNLWYFKYDFGELPETLKDIKFTKFDQAKSFLEKYFTTRNIRIKEVI